MPNEKVLNRLKKQIRELNSLLEPFSDENVEPTALDCEKLQQQLCALQEGLAVFKYNKQNHEVSPSFNIHARVSKEVPDEPLVTPEEPETRMKAEKPVVNVPATETVVPPKIAAVITIGINDKFRFINELFAQNPAEYNIALEQLSNLHNWPETEMYLSSLKTLYAWKEQQDVVKHFYSLFKRRFE
jgi:hypothetical protein